MTANVLDYQKPSTAFDFFARPPKEIGPVLYSESTLRQGRQPLPRHVRLLASLVPAVAAVAGVLWFAEVPQAPGLRPGPAIVAALFAMAAVAAGWHFTRFEHRCAYVGQYGVAEFELRDNRAAPPASRMLLFHDAAQLKRRSIHGVIECRWIDAAGLRRYESNRASDHFATAAAAAWHAHCLASEVARPPQRGQRTLI